MAQLPKLSEHGLLKQTKDNSYSIQVALKKAVSQRNAELYLKLHLQKSGDYADAFLIGVLTSSTFSKSMVLEWLFRDLKFNPTTSRLKTKSLCIKYYLIEKAHCKLIDLSASSHCGLLEATAIQHKLPLQLIVFIYKVSDTHHNGDITKLCMEYIISIVTKNKLPFIFCLDCTNSKSSTIAITLMKKVVTILQVSLANTYRLIVTDASSEENKSVSQISTMSVNLDSKTALRDYQRSLTDVSMEGNGNFIGREKELATLSTLLNDDACQYITIKGFGGIGKTCLAIQAAKNFNSESILALSLMGTPTLSSVIRKIARFLGIETKELEPQEQKTRVFEMLNGKEIILLYLDNMEDIKNAIYGGNSEAKDLMRFFQCMPKNVKILATSRVTLGWPNEEIMELHGLAPSDGMKVFRQWSIQRKNDIDDASALKLSELVHGHSLSLRLLGGVFDNCGEPMEEFLNNIRNRLSTAVDNNSTDDRHESINTCIGYSFGNLNQTLRSLLRQLKSFEIPFCKTIAVRALGLDITSTATENNLHNLWQRSWLNQHIYQEDPMLSDWRPRAIEKDTRFYSLHPRLRDFLDEQFKDTNSAMSNDCEVQFYTALCYGVGFGIVNNLDKQIEWCKKAADNGHLEAQLILASCYESGGGGVCEDEKEASYWYLKAAEAGDKRAQQEMKWRFFYSGKGVEKDNDKGKYWKKLCDENKTEPLKIKFDFSLPLVHRATEFGAMDLVRSLMEQKLAKVDIKDGHGRTPLHIAAEKGHIGIFQMLALEFDAEINATTKDGRTPLGMAAVNGHFNFIRLLVDELGADVNAKDEKGRTLFYWAAKSGQIEALKSLTAKVTDLNFGSNHIGDSGAHALAESLKQNTTLTLLDLSNNRIGAEGAHALAESLKQNTTLTQLSLRYNGIGDSGAHALGESLKHNTTLTKLNLHSNGIGDSGAHALAESLKQNKTLTLLSLAGLANNIGDSGAHALAESLKQNTTLTLLDLSVNKIGDSGANALAESLKQNTTLTQLDLWWNEIGDSGAHALTESLKQNTTLTQLNLADNGVSDSGAHALAESLKQNTTLTQLDLVANDIGDSGAHALAESLKQNTTLTQLYLSDNGIGDSGAHALRESLIQKKIFMLHL